MTLPDATALIFCPSGAESTMPFQTICPERLLPKRLPHSIPLVGHVNLAF